MTKNPENIILRKQNHVTPDSWKYNKNETLQLKPYITPHYTTQNKVEFPQIKIIQKNKFD